MKSKVDAIIIGTGQAGPSLAVRLAGAGMQVAIIERKRFGGTWPKPSKAVTSRHNPNKCL